MELTELTINQIHQGLIKKEFSALELCKTYLEKIQKKDKEISAYLAVSKESALSQAKTLRPKKPESLPSKHLKFRSAAPIFFPKPELRLFRQCFLNQLF